MLCNVLLAVGKEEVLKGIMPSMRARSQSSFDVSTHDSNYSRSMCSLKVCIICDCLAIVSEQMFLFLFLS